MLAPTSDRCDDGGTWRCLYTWIAGCKVSCQTAADCEDGDPCTLDWCTGPPWSGCTFDLPPDCP